MNKENVDKLIFEFALYVFTPLYTAFTIALAAVVILY